MLPTWLPWWLQPSWLQAYAATTALFISVWASIRVSRAETRRTRVRARSIALVILPDLMKLPIQCETAAKRLDELRERMKRQAGQFVAAGLQLAGSVSVPAMLEHHFDRLFVLGEPAGHSCVQLVYLLKQYDDILHDISTSIVSKMDWTEAVDQLKPHLSLITASAEKCVREVTPIHDAIKG